MAYLHENRTEFEIAVNLASAKHHILEVVAEKDYYVTMILRELAERLPFVVFKGGTSLSKCHRAINRFSEDIDITIDTRISTSQKRSLKETIKAIADKLGMKIPNIEDTRSRRNYNKYILEYDSIFDEEVAAVLSAVTLETSFSEVSFPTDRLLVHSYIGDMMETEAPDAIKEYLLDPFEMKVQGLNRTFVDKVFAICDYYLDGKVERHSRHIYDLYKLLAFVPLNDELKSLVKEVRAVRVTAGISVAAQPVIKIPELLEHLITHNVYRTDYEVITARILEEEIPYDEAIYALREIINSKVFET